MTHTPANSEPLGYLRKPSYWVDAARSMKRAILGGRTFRMGGASFRVAYEARHVREFPDYLFLQACARGRRCVFDVGANVGATTLVMSSYLARDGRIVAFEPSEASVLVIRENARLNGILDRIQVVNALICEQSGVPEIFHWNHVSSRSNVVRARASETIPMSKVSLSLDSYCETTGVVPDFVKIDVEGSEARVVAGMRSIMTSHDILVYVELHGWPEHPVGETASDVLREARQSGFDMIDIRSKTRVEEPLQFYHDMKPPANSIHSQARVLLTKSPHGIPSFLTTFDTSHL